MRSLLINTAASGVAPEYRVAGSGAARRVGVTPVEARRGRGGTVAPEAAREAVSNAELDRRYRDRAHDEGGGGSYKATLEYGAPLVERKPREPAESSPQTADEVISEPWVLGYRGLPALRSGALRGRPDAPRRGLNPALHVHEIGVQDGRAARDDHGGQRGSYEAAGPPQAGGHRGGQRRGETGGHDRAAAYYGTPFAVLTSHCHNAEYTSTLPPVFKGSTGPSCETFREPSARMDTAPQGPGQPFR